MNLHHADRAAEAAMFMENRMRYVQQSAQTRDGYRADIPPRVLAPIFGNTLPSGPSATEYPYPPVAGGLEPDYASEQYPQDPIRSYADRRGT